MARVLRLGLPEFQIPEDVLSLSTSLCCFGGLVSSSVKVAVRSKFVFFILGFATERVLLRKANARNASITTNLRAKTYDINP